MKIKSVAINNRKKTFEINTRNGETLIYPYSKLELLPSKMNHIVAAFIDPDIGGDGFCYQLSNGEEDTIHIDQILDYNQDPEYMRKMKLYQLSIDAQAIVEKKKITKNELVRRMKCSKIQLNRLLDQTFYSKTIDQMLKLFYALDIDVEFVLKKLA